ncbi:hypothetical protein [Lentzea sp. NPDC051838]|uniref:hypothetical protein n=1 Tax=Lentzea sp. NPDC051838 TaxID=3154849 RepID=UPI0034464A99
MAPPDRKPDLDAPEKYNLDLDFHHSPEISVWADWLLHPEQHDYWRIYVYPSGDKEEFPRRSKQWEQENPVTTESVIQGLYVEQFFDPAQGLSGQKLGDATIMHLTGQGLINASWRVEDWSDRLAGGFEDVRKYWDNSTACTNAGDFLGAINTYAKKHAEITAQMAVVLLRYASTIKASRQRLDEAMKQLVDAFHTKHYASDTPTGKILAAAISVIAATALTAVTAGGSSVVAPAVAAGMATLVDKVAGAALEEDVKQEITEIKGQSWRSIVDSYFFAQAEILKRAGDEVGALKSEITKLKAELARLAPIPELKVGPC